MSTINPTTSATHAAQLYAAGIAEDGQDYTEETSGGSSSHSVEQPADSVEFTDEARALAEASGATPDEDAFDDFLQFNTPETLFGSRASKNPYNRYNMGLSGYDYRISAIRTSWNYEREEREASTEEYAKKQAILRQYENTQEYKDYIKGWEQRAIDYNRKPNHSDVISNYDGLLNHEKFDVLEHYLGQQIYSAGKVLTEQEREAYNGAASSEWIRDNRMTSAQLSDIAQSVQQHLAENNSPLDTNERYYFSIDRNFNFVVTGNNVEQAKRIQDSINSNAESRIDMFYAILKNDGEVWERNSDMRSKLSAYYEYYSCLTYLNDTLGISYDDIELEYYDDNKKVRGIGKTDAARKALEENPALAARLSGIDYLIKQNGIPKFPITDSPQLLFTGGEFSLLV